NPILEEIDLLGVSDRHPFSLSMGQKRRLSVAAMLVLKPKMLILDEPTFGQDKAMTLSLIRLIKQLQNRGLGVLLITHDMRLVEEIVDNVVVMSEGRVVFEG